MSPARARAYACIAYYHRNHQAPQQPHKLQEHVHPATTFHLFKWTGEYCYIHHPSHVGTRALPRDAEQYDPMERNIAYKRASERRRIGLHETSTWAVA